MREMITTPHFRVACITYVHTTYHLNVQLYFCSDKVLRRRQRGSVTTSNPHQYWCVCDYGGSLNQLNQQHLPHTCKSQINTLKILSKKPSRTAAEWRKLSPTATAASHPNLSLNLSRNRDGVSRLAWKDFKNLSTFYLARDLGHFDNSGRATCSGPRRSSFTGTLCEFKFRRGTLLCDSETPSFTKKIQLQRATLRVRILSWHCASQS